MSGTIHLPELALTPDAALTNHRRLYSKTDGWYQQDDAGLEHRVTHAELIERVVLTASAASVTFASIPQIYRHLMLMCVARSDHTGSTSRSVDMTFNNDTGTNYDWQRIRAIDGSPTGTFDAQFVTSATALRVANTSTADSSANSFGYIETTIQEYRNVSFYKMVQSRDSHVGVIHTSDFRMHDLRGIWANTNAITEIELAATTVNFVANSAFELWGIF